MPRRGIPAWHDGDAINGGYGPRGQPALRAPSMGALLRVKVPPQVDHDE